MSLKSSASTPLLGSLVLDVESSTTIRKVHLRLSSNSSDFRKVRSETDLQKLDKDKGQRSPANDQVPSIKSAMLNYRGLPHKTSGLDEVNGSKTGLLDLDLDVDPIYIGVGGGFGIGGRGDHHAHHSNSNHNNFDGDFYYQEMLETNPGNPLLLRNYARFLHEVKHDMVKAEEYYERAMLACPQDGDVLAAYAKLIWEVGNDPQRAEIYFDQAVQAAPENCYVLASHAHFLWNTEEDEEEESGMQEPHELLSGFTSTSVAAAAFS